MTREVRQLRKTLWESMQGCVCKLVRKEGGKTIAASKDEVCTREAVRCNGRHNRIVRDYEKHGLKIGPVAPGESGLAE